MKLEKTLVISAMALLALTMGTNARADWAQASDPVVVQPAPKDYQIQVQNPPTFTWSRHPTGPASYTLEIKSGGTVYQTYTSTRNWYLPSKAMPQGTYTWRVRPTNSTDWSVDRPFVIDSTAAIFEVPENEDLRAAIVKRVRPRGIQQDLPLFSSWGASIRAERTGAYNKLYAEVDWFTTKLPPVKDSDWQLVTNGALTAAAVVQTNAVRTAIYAVGRQLEAAALMYRLSGEAKFLTETLARGDQLAALGVDGPTSYVNQDQGTRVIALSLIKAIDCLNGKLDATRRATWLKAVELRTNAIYADLAGSNGRMDQYPFDSHGGSNLGFLALIATLSLGDIPVAQTWFDFAFRDYVGSFSAWSGPEGGFANGSAYAQYTADFALQIWQPLAHATGIDMFSKPWSAGFLRYFMHFVPPGTARHVFGDENEVVPTVNVLKGYAAHYKTTAAAWYYQALTGDMDSLVLLQAPYPLPVNMAAGRVAPSNSALYPSIGWVALHSSLVDLNRTSIYFKSSPYGSYNHSHAEQNTFVLAVGGVQLLGQSGYSDFYGSPLWSSWYRQTKAHNGITYDGGIGQSTDGYTKAGYTKTMANTGKINAFSSTSSQDYVEGDATAAYDGVLSRATRKMWYLRPINAVVVQDLLAAPSAHVFEWNFHTYAPIAAGAGGRSIISYMGKTACIVPITPGLKFEKRVGPPPKAGTVEDHGVYLAPSGTSAEFLMLLDIGCQNPTVSLTTNASGRTLTVGTQVLNLPK